MPELQEEYLQELRGLPFDLLLLRVLPPPRGKFGTARQRSCLDCGARTERGRQLCQQCRDHRRRRGAPMPDRLIDAHVQVSSILPGVSTATIYGWRSGRAVPLISTLEKYRHGLESLGVPFDIWLNARATSLKGRPDYKKQKYAPVICSRGHPLEDEVNYCRQCATQTHKSGLRECSSCGQMKLIPGYRKECNTCALERFPEPVFRGVRRTRSGVRPYEARITFQHVDYYLGNFADAEEAAHAYDSKVRELLGDRAAFGQWGIALNFPSAEEIVLKSTANCCRECGIQKPLESFRMRSPGRRRSICKDCYNASQRARQDAHKQSLRLGSGFDNLFVCQPGNLSPSPPPSCSSPASWPLRSASAPAPRRQS